VPSGLGSAADVTAAQSTANSAASAASAAQSAANSANAALSDIASDGKLTPVEKRRARLEWDTILAERAGIQGQADTFGVSRTAYDSAFQSLANYLNAGTAWASGAPSWLADANLGTTTTIVGSTFRDNWKALYDARQALLNAVADKARQNAAAAQSTANSAASAASAAQSTADSAASAAAYADALARSSFNLIKNGNSEDTDPTGYEAAGINATPGYARNGSKCRTILTSTAYTNLVLTPLIPCSEGDEFYFEGWAKSTKGTYPYTPRLLFRFIGTGTTLLWAYDARSSLGTTWQKLSASGVAPAGTVAVEFSVDSGATVVPGGIIAWDDFYATRKISAGVIEADAVQTIHLNAYAVTAAKIATDAVKTSNYAEDAYGNPTAGAWLGVGAAQPMKCGPNGLKIGKGTFNQQSLIFDRVFNGMLWYSATGWSLSGTNTPVWSGSNPHTTGCGTLLSSKDGTVATGTTGTVTSVGEASQVLNLPTPDPNVTTRNMTLWLRIGYEWIVEGVYVGSSGYAKLYLQNLTTGGAKTLIGTVSTTTINAWTEGTYNISSVYTAAGVYGLTVELSCGVTIQAIGAPRSVRAKAQVSDIQAIF
jgi:hypothetical protein